ncbi:MAG: FtsK/SpoIIIE domain-containing protein [Acidimicrobiia bacterium]|nr:FtsK/SpoIIIE domain-containing protein [Acidimicrobiia bacterium]
MELMIRAGDNEYEVSCDLEGREGTLGELVDGWGLDDAATIAIDGRRACRTMPLAEAGLGEASVVEVGAPIAAGSRGPVGSAAGVFNRPPRLVTAVARAPLLVPQAPQEPPKATRFGWAALVVPVVLGLTMAVLIHPRMAMFAVFSPAMLLANWFEDRRRATRERRNTDQAYGTALERFEAEVGSAYRGAIAAAFAATTCPQELMQRVAGADSRLWERRAEHADFLELPIGTGCLPWQPHLEGQLDARSSAMLQRFSELHEVPLQIRLVAGTTTGIAGARHEVLGLARQIVTQAAAHHGPADLAITVLSENRSDWDWVKWLPHVKIEGGAGRRLAATDEELAAVAAALPIGDEREPAPPHHLVVVDLPDLVGGARPAIRTALRDGAKRSIAGLALAAQAAALPSLATTIVAFDKQLCRVRLPDGREAGVSPWLLDTAHARQAARALARLEDPEAQAGGAGLPSVAYLPAMLGLGPGLEGPIRRRWERPCARPATPIGYSDDGLMIVDLITDGPHALLGGTTGAGKSELLRTLVAGLAVECSPAALNFVLIDYKGGSAFDACATLAHTVGVVTDLDDHLASRALLCLDAELRHRESRLRSAAVSDISELVDPDDPLPRLLVVIDEFAALAKELPDFIDALVGIAQRGRSLGVHLVLATQRPSGVISESIRANTNLRIALRMQDSVDSVDVIGSAAAAQIGRNQPGRGMARLGPQDTVAFQTAIVTDRSLAANERHLPTFPFVFAHEQPRPVTPGGSSDGPTDLERIVAAAVRVADAMGLPAPRLPWPEPLPSQLVPADVPHPGGAGTVFALADEPHRQRRVGVVWSPSAGNLLLYGLPGSGTTTALASLITGLARDNEPERFHMYVLDFDDQLLAPLAQLPHVGAVVGVQERERQLRLLRRLSEELQRRRDAMVRNPDFGSTAPIVAVGLDNFGGFADAYDEPGDMTARNLMARIVADGPGVGIYTFITAKHPGDIPTRIASLVGSKIALHLADRYDYSGLGIPAVAPPPYPGRAFESGSGREIQIVLPHRDGLRAAVAANQWGRPLVAPWQIEVLPREVSVAEFGTAGCIADDEWFLPLGIGDTSLLPSGWVLRDGQHALITGPARSGKSTALTTIAAVAKAARPDLIVSALTPRHSPLCDLPEVDRTITLDSLDQLNDSAAQLILVDDAELVAASPHLSQLANGRRRGLRIVAAGSADAIRSLYGHWTQDVRRSRIGCALRPNLTTDGDLWQTQLPRRGPEDFPAGRGYLLSEGQAELIQLGRP